MTALCSLCGLLCTSQDCGLVNDPGANTIDFQRVSVEVLKHLNHAHGNTPQVAALNLFLQNLGVLLASAAAVSSDERYSTQQRLVFGGLRQQIEAMESALLASSASPEMYA